MASSWNPSTSQPTPSAPPPEAVPTFQSSAPPLDDDDHFPTDFEFTDDIDDGHSHEATATTSHVTSTNVTTLTPKSQYSNQTPSTSTPMASPQTSTPTASPQTSTATISDDNDDRDENATKKDDSMFECNICLDTAKEAVISLCGHLFCWPCLHQWLETRPSRQLCPVCKAAISREKVIPLYGRGSSKQEDPRSKVPPRPAGQRTEPEPNTAFQGFGFGDGGFQMSLGIGAFPFGILTSTFNFGTNLRTQNPNTTIQTDDDQLLSKTFLYIAIIFLGWLIFVA